jgi:hypothetical protein
MFDGLVSTHCKRCSSFCLTISDIRKSGFLTWRHQVTELTVENLLEQFTIARHTGLEKPGRWEVFSYESSLKHCPLKKASTTVSNLEAGKPPQKLLIQTSSVSPSASSSQGKKKHAGKKLGCTRGRDSVSGTVSRRLVEKHLADWRGCVDQISVGEMVLDQASLKPF